MADTHEYPIVPEGRGEDLIGLEQADDADLILFMAGNQFMVMHQLLDAFKREHPQVRRIFCETLPPRLELDQILANGARFKERLLPGRPDVYASVSAEAVDILAKADLLEPERPFAYLHNRITIMVPADNPARVSTVADLGREGVVVSQPNPAYEDIAAHIMEMYRDAGGEALVRRIMEEKRDSGETLLTTVHHRETPERLLTGQAHAGPVWATEAAHAKALGLGLDNVEVGPELDQHARVNYYLCPMKKSPNPGNGAAFAAFIQSPAALSIYRKAGFTPPNTST